MKTKPQFDRRFKLALNSEVGSLGFGVFMRAARTSMDLTQERFGKKIGMSRAAVSEIEKGRRLVGVEFAAQIAKKARLPEKLAVHACLLDQKKGLTSGDIAVLQFRSFLAAGIYRLNREKHFRLQEIATKSRMSRAQVVAIVRGQIDDVPSEGLIRVLRAMGYRVKFG